MYFLWVGQLVQINNDQQTQLAAAAQDTGDLVYFTLIHSLSRTRDASTEPSMKPSWSLSAISDSEQRPQLGRRMKRKRVSPGPVTQQKWFRNQHAQVRGPTPGSLHRRKAYTRDLSLPNWPGKRPFTLTSLLPIGI